MNVFTLIILIIVSIILTVLLTALFVRKEYAVKRSLKIDRPIAEVFDYLRYLVNQEQFSKWVMTDLNMEKTCIGTDGNPGFIYKWDSKQQQAGAGEQEIIAIDLNNLIDIEVRFSRPFKGIAKTPIITDYVSDNETNVIWSMNSKMSYPMNIMLLFGIEKILSKDLEISLMNLKNILEKHN